MRAPEFFPDRVWIKDCRIDREMDCAHGRCASLTILCGTNAGGLQSSSCDTSPMALNDPNKLDCQKVPLEWWRQDGRLSYFDLRSLVKPTLAAFGLSHKQRLKYREVLSSEV